MKKYYLSSNSYIYTICIFLVFVYNYLILISKFNIFSSSKITISYVNILGEFLFLLATLIIFFTIFNFSKILIKLWAIVFICGNSFVGYFILFNKIYFDETIVGSIFETNSHEIIAFLNYKLVLWLIFTWLLPLLVFVFKFKIVNNKNKNNVFLQYFINLIIPILISTICYFASMYANPNMHKHARGIRAVYGNYMPFNYVVAFYQYFIRYKNITLPSVDIFKTYNFNYKQDSAFKNNNFNVVLIIGESDRADRHSMLGYKHNTNPLLSKVDNLVVFNNFNSCATISRLSVNCILSYNTKAEFTYPPQEQNIFSVFNGLGFNTAFLSSQSAYEKGNNSFYLAAFLANKIIFSSSLRGQTTSNGYIYDEYLIPHIKNILQNKAVGNFIVLYLTGSHAPYKYRYPSNFNVFNNDYDNTIIYTDYVLNEIINLFKNTSTLVFYVADHGESLGENGIEGHGSTPAPKEQEHVFSFVWVSNDMKVMLKEKYTNLASKKFNNLSHDNVFYTLMGCFDINSSLLINNKKLNLCF